MGIVEAFQIPRCRCWFYTGDHEAPHFHVQDPDRWEIRVFFLREPVEYEVKWRAKHIPSRVVREVLTLAARHRAELFDQWERSTPDE